MKFSLQVNLNEEDFCRFNEFIILRSPYGKRIGLVQRIIIPLLYLSFCLIAFLLCGVTVFSVAFTFLMLLAACVQTLCYPLAIKSSIKSTLKSFKKKGRLPYSPVSAFEFYEDSFVETSEFNKTETKYTGIERISIVENRTMYLHLNSASGYMLPITAFSSQEHCNEFMAFIKTKCPIIEIYN